MPRVQQIEQGNNVSAIRGTSDRTRSLIAKRNQLGLYLPPQTVTISLQPVGNTDVTLGTMPRLIGPSGSAWMSAGYGSAIETLGNTFILFVLIDGGVFVPGKQDGAGVAGITPGWHNFALQIVCSSEFGGGTIQVVNPWMMVWPF
jgi:hypothetical protein